MSVSETIPKNSEIVELLQRLIRCESVTPKSNGSIEIIDKILQDNGFTTYVQKFKESETVNLYARFGNTEPNICFAGHVDVVPPGDEQLWQYPPFAGKVTAGYVHGRGAVDMKGSIAVFVVAAIDFVKLNPEFNGSLSFLITSDEEGDGQFGTRKVLEYLKHLHGERAAINFAIVGEPTTVKIIGDTIKIGRRGSINFNLKVIGKQGHVAYPRQADNPLPKLIEAMGYLLNIKLDNGNEYFDPSNLEITAINTDNFIKNVIPESCQANFNIRFNDQHSSESLYKLMFDSLSQLNFPFELSYTASAEPFIQKTCDLIEVFKNAVEDVTGVKATYSTTGGTSDARYIQNYCQVVELGLASDKAHKIDEAVEIKDLQNLYDVYYHSLCKLLKTTTS